MTLDEQELENCRREVQRLKELLSRHKSKVSETIMRLIVVQEQELEILYRIEAAKGSTDG